ncbi:MAG: hypothetical protein WBX15_02260 [Thermoanaerobaculia bacterium]
MRTLILLLGVSLAALAADGSSFPPRQGPVNRPELVPYACTSIEIPNFQISQIGETQFRLTWNAPANVPEPQYDVLANVRPGSCQSDDQHLVLGTTSQTTLDVTLPVAEREYALYVVEHSCAQISTAFAWIVDSFTDTPAAPTLTLGAIGTNSVSFTYVQPAPDHGALLLQRSTDGNKWGNITFLDYCPAGSSHSVTDNAVPKGTYHYRLVAFNNTSYTFSKEVLASVGTTVPPPSIDSFAALPAQIRAGDTARLVWSARNATSISIDPEVGMHDPSGSVNVAPTGSTTYKLTAVGSGGTATATTTLDVLTAPEVRITGFPETMVQGTSGAGATTSFTVTNIGGSSTTVNMSTAGGFFNISPARLDLTPGKSAGVSVTSNSSLASGRYGGTISFTGAGVPAGLQVPVLCLATPTPNGTTSAVADQKRVDLAGPSGSAPSGSVSFQNTGTATMFALASSDVPWIEPDTSLIEIAPGVSSPVSFRINRSLRPDANAPSGTVTGNLSLVFRAGASGKLAADDGATSLGRTSLVTVTDTSRPATSSSTIPPLAAGELAQFVAGVGHLVGSTGQFISDVALTNLASSNDLSGLSFYYSTLGSPSSTPSLLAQLQKIGANTPVQFSDIVSTVFNRTSESGSLLIRGSQANNLTPSATILNVSDARGTYGTAIPILRSDRSAGPGESLMLSGLRKTADGHTNFFIQETNGGNVTVTTSWLDANGSVLASLTETIPPFGLLRILDSDQIPTSMVSARISSSPTSTGRFAAYATPLDRLSRDFWAVTDWNRQNAMSGSDPMLVPVAGTVHGANNAFFRTDLSVMNSGDSNGVANVLYHYTDINTGATAEKAASVSLGTLQSRTFGDVAGSLFNLTTNTLGYIIFTPQSGKFVVTSRTYSTVSGQPGTFGTGVTTLPLSASLRLGQTRTIGGVKDSSLVSIQTAKGGTFRTNFGMIETAGATAVVRVTVYFSYQSTGRAVQVGRDSAWKEYTLAPHQSMQISRITNEILGDERRSQLGDLDNLEVEFSVVGGDGAVATYLSSVDNGTSDSILRTE